MTPYLFLVFAEAGEDDLYVLPCGDDAAALARAQALLSAGDRFLFVEVWDGARPVVALSRPAPPGAQPVAA